MKLTDLEPRWVSEQGQSRQGVRFRCPRCEDYVVVPFANPIGGGPPMSGKFNLWKRTGETFETLTLEPSIMQPRGC